MKAAIKRDFVFYGVSLPSLRAGDIVEVSPATVGLDRSEEYYLVSVPAYQQGTEDVLMFRRYFELLGEGTK